MNQQQIITRFCELQLILAKHKTGRISTSLIEEISQIRRLAWENQIAPDELHLASLRFFYADLL
ncbi:hypothetical protein IQ243_20580 [Nostocales cyanobacterium LEGE 11386]|nr:hypothetical protein [Nostocales cyanobacterium LEGE 11386]